MTIDSELVTRKLLLIARDLDALTAIRNRGQDAYLTSRVDQAVAERHLERMIGRMIDSQLSPADRVWPGAAGRLLRFLCAVGLDRCCRRWLRP